MWRKIIRHLRLKSIALRCCARGITFWFYAHVYHNNQIICITLNKSNISIFSFAQNVLHVPSIHLTLIQFMRKHTVLLEAIIWFQQVWSQIAPCSTMTIHRAATSSSLGSNSQKMKNYLSQNAVLYNSLIMCLNINRKIMGATFCSVGTNLVIFWKPCIWFHIWVVSVLLSIHFISYITPKATVQEQKNSKLSHLQKWQLHSQKTLIISSEYNQITV